MPVPSFTMSGLLPPFTGGDPTNPSSHSPYIVTISEVVARFATSPQRISILLGLLDYRDQLRAEGILDGYQWLDGSFVEDAENTRGRAPQDIDLVTLAIRPVGCSLPDWVTLVTRRPDIFDPAQAKNRYHCDAYYVDLALRWQLVVAQVIYYFGLFSHNRVQQTWKGMLQVPLVSDDAVARGMIP